MKFKVIVFLFASFFLLNINLGSWGVTETSEARYAEISKEMLESGDFIHPTLMGIAHYHKPPLTYYITTLGYKIFGVNEYGARFFLQVAIIIQLLLIYQIALLLFKDETIAFSAMLIYFSLPLVLISSRNLTTDAYLNTSVLAAIYFWLSYRLKNFKPHYIYLFFLMLGISFEIKGPIGFIFVFVFILSYYFVSKQRMRLSIHHLFGFLCFLAVAFSWYLIILQERPLLWDYFFENQLVKRAISQSYHRGKPFWFYLLIVPLIALPWFPFLVHQSIKKFKHLRKEKSWDYILLLTITITLLIFSIFKTKLILYVLPSFGFVALLSAQLISKVELKTQNIYNKVILTIAFIISTSIIAVSLIGHDFNFNGFLALAIAVISALAFFILNKKHYSKSYLRTVWLGYAFGCLILIVGNDFLIQNQANLKSTKPVMAFIAKELKDTQTIFAYNYLLPSAEFYSDKKIVTLNNGHNTVQRETQFESDDHWKPYNLDVQTEDGIKQALEGVKTNAVLIVRKKIDIRRSHNNLVENFKHTKDFGVWRIYY